MRWLPAVAIALVGSTSVCAQPVGVTRRAPLDSAATHGAFPFTSAVRWHAPEPSRRWPSITRESVKNFAPLASAIVPGSGQFALGEDRFLVYSALEVGFWLRRANDEADRRRQERQFRAFARDVARSRFAGPHPDGDWAYYEQMRGDFLESGAYSLSLATVVPETDTLTVNGNLWLRAQEHNPDRATALAEYMARAVPETMRWSWRDAQLQWDLFKRATELRNTAAGRAAFDLIVIGANHVISMVDAFTTVRLQARPQPAGGLSLTASIPWR
jgi:hypothetical protein